MFSCASPLSRTLSLALQTRDPALAEALARNSNIAGALARKPVLAGAIANALARERVLAQDPDLAGQLAGSLAREPAIVTAFARDPAFACAFAGAIAREPAFVGAFALKPASTGALTRDTAFARALAKVLFRDFKIAKALVDVYEQEPALACAITREPAPLVFGVDEANQCIRRLYPNTNRIAEVYKPEGDARVHNLLLPDTFDENHLCAIESTRVSRLVGVLIRQETLFRLVLLSWHYTNDSADKEKWETTWSAEFYRTDTELLDAERPLTALCRAGSYVLCAVARSHRLVAFEYKSPNEPLKRQEINASRRK